MPPTQTTSLRRTRTRRFIPTPCIHPEARLLNQDILQEMAQRDNSASTNRIPHKQPQHTQPDPQLQHINALFERWDRVVETQKELMRWIKGVKIEREGEEGSRVCDEVASGWEDLGEVYGGEVGWYVFGEREGGELMRWRLKRKGVV